MLKLSKPLFISIIIPAFTYCQFIPTDDTNLAHFEIFRNSYNSESYEVIYKQFTQEVKSQLSLANFEATLQSIKDRVGTIDYWTYTTPDPNNPAALVGFKNNLAAGLVTWSYDDTKLKSLIINDFSNPTFVEFMKNNPNKVAFTAISDDKVLIDYNGNKPHDLMSVFKITVAVEFSRQVTQGIIDPNQWISISDLNKYYIEDLDSAHGLFLQLWTQMGKIVDDKVQLIEIANGMIALSSNTNTEFLQAFLTLDSINKTINDIGLNQTTSYYLNSMFLVYLNKNNLSREDYIKQIKSFTPEYVFEQSNQMHAILVKGGQEAKDLLSRGKELLDGEVLGIQAQIFTKSTSNGYSQLLNKLNKGELFDEKFYESFYPLIGYVSLKNPSLAKIYKHTGVKGGSSAYPGDTECVLSIGQFYELYEPFPYRKTSYALFTEGLNYETEYVHLITQFNYFTALLGLNGHYLTAVTKELEKVKTDNIM